MANLMINTFCNLRCPYCFAEDDKQAYVNEEMDMETIKKATEYILQTDNTVGLIGGEPTFHKDFKKILYYLFDNDKVANIVLYTNGTNLEKYKNLLVNKKIGMLINLNSNGICSQQKIEEIVKNAKWINDEKAKRGFWGQVNFGINIFSPTQEIDYIFKALKELNLHRIRYSVSIQQFEIDSTPDPLQYFKLMKPKIIEFFDKCVENEIVAGEDCNYIPWCILTEDERQKYNNAFIEIAQKYNQEFSLIASNNGCLNGNCPLDIHCDLTVSRCFGTSEQTKIDILDFKNLNEIRAYYSKMFDSMCKVTPISNSCTKECNNYYFCEGSCLKYKANSVIKIKEFIGGGKLNVNNGFRQS